MTTLKIAREMSVDVAISTVAKSDGSVDVTANGSPVLTFRKDGYLVRLKSTAAVGLRRLPDGRIAMPKRRR